MHNLFGYKHIILIILSIIVIVLGYIFSRKAKFNKLVLSIFSIGIISETIKILYYTIQNESNYVDAAYLPKSDLPFHLCSIQIVFIAILHYSKNEKIKRLLMSFMLPSCLIGGIAALLIPPYTPRNGLWIISLQYFGYHCAIIVFALNLLLRKEMNWKLKDILNCFKILGLFGFLSIYINSMLYDGVSNINFMYTAKPPQDNLPYLNLDQGWFMYIIKYALLAVVAILGCYSKTIIDAVKEFKSTKLAK